jgi:hypothetical protein
MEKHMNKFTRPNHVFWIILFVTFLLIYISRTYLNHIFGGIIELMIAVGGLFAVITQLRNNHNITKAEFIYSLNNTFNDNDEIRYIYMKLKSIRDNHEISNFTIDEGKRMGDYIMFFKIMEYLIAQRMVSISLVDRIFANKFFIFVNNPCVQKMQLKYTGINESMIDLYVIWHNYRVKHHYKELYPQSSFYLYEDYFVRNQQGLISFNTLRQDINP